jgi:hypothetical protein
MTPDEGARTAVRCRFPARRGRSRSLGNESQIHEYRDSRDSFFSIVSIAGCACDVRDLVIGELANRRADDLGVGDKRARPVTGGVLVACVPEAFAPAHGGRPSI